MKNKYKEKPVDKSFSIDRLKRRMKKKRKKWHGSFTGPRLAVTSNIPLVYIKQIYKYKVSYKFSHAIYTESYLVSNFSLYSELPARETSKALSNFGICKHQLTHTINTCGILTLPVIF